MPEGFWWGWRGGLWKANDSYRARGRCRWKGWERRSSGPQRLKKQSKPAFHLVLGSSLPSVGQHPSQVTRTPRLLCGMQQASSWSLQLPLGLGRPKSFGLTVRKASLQLCLPRLSACPVLNIRGAGLSTGTRSKASQVASCQKQSYAWTGGLAPAADTHLARGKQFMAFMGEVWRKGKEERMTGHFTCPSILVIPVATALTFFFCFFK